MLDHLMYTLTPLRQVVPTWDWVYEFFAGSKENNERKEILRVAIDFLYGEFGKGFFHTCGQNHPVCIMITTYLSRTQELLDFVQCLQAHKIASSESYTILISKLKPRKKCQTEGIPFYNLLRAFSANGFKVKFLKESGLVQTPDIEIVEDISGERIFVEVSQLQQSLAQRSTQEQHREISNAFLLHGFDLPKACRQLKPLDDEEMERIVTTIKRIKDKAAFEQEFVAYEDEFIRMAVAHPTKLDQLKEWCAHTGIKMSSMEGLSVDYNDTPRLVNKSKLKEEIKQLPAEQPGFIYVPVTYLYFLSMDIAEIIMAVIEQLAGYPNCIGVALYASSVGSLFNDELIEAAGTHRRVKTVNGITHHTLYIGNPFFNKIMPPHSLHKFQSCF